MPNIRIPHVFVFLGTYTKLSPEGSMNTLLADGDLAGSGNKVQGVGVSGML